MIIKKEDGSICTVNQLYFYENKQTKIRMVSTLKYPFHNNFYQHFLIVNY